MLSVAEAIAAILDRSRPLPARRALLADALGLTLAEDVVADIDLPPFDKALMDGHAVRSADLDSPGQHRLVVVDEILAGRAPTRALARGEAARIMTGAPLPPGADAVVMIERATCLDDGAILLPGPVAAGLNRLTRGREMRRGDVLLRHGDRIDARKLGLIASAGLAEVAVIPMPAVAVVPTGDELVPIGRRPDPGQIRNSNGIMLAGLARAWGARHVEEGPIAPDDPEGLRLALAGYLHPPGAADVLIVCGGVSAGSKDLVPPALVALGVEPVFHKVNVKPGKPLWFGVGPERGDGPGPLVFGLPGNPASGLVGFLLFVRPALEALSGRLAPPAPLPSKRLAAPFSHRGDRPTYHPARLEADRVTPLDWAGSADLRTVALADGFVAFPAGDHDYEVGDAIPFLEAL